MRHRSRRFSTAGSKLPPPAAPVPTAPPGEAPAGKAAARETPGRAVEAGRAAWKTGRSAGRHIDLAAIFLLPLESFFHRDEAVAVGVHCLEVAHRAVRGLP